MERQTSSDSGQYGGFNRTLEAPRELSTPAGESTEATQTEAATVSLPVAEPGIAPARVPKPRPGPLQFRDENNLKSSSTRQYGTFAAPAIAAEGLGAGDLVEKSEDPATAEYWRHRRASETADGAAEGDMGLWEYLTSPQSPLIQIRDHCHHQWVAILLTMLLLGLILFFVFGASSPQRATGCNSDFGVYLGEHRQVAAYSNCKYAYTGDGLDHYLTVGLQRVYSGSKWHALEYARRYWILSRLLTFPSVDTPDMLFNVTNAYVVTTAGSVTTSSRTTVYGNGGDVLRKGQQLPVQHFFNLLEPLLRGNAAQPATDFLGSAVPASKRTTPVANVANASSLASAIPLVASTAGPADAARRRVAMNPNGVPLKDFVLDRSLARLQEGDLLVYAKHRNSLPNGHVAVVVGVQGPYRTLDDVGHRVLDSPRESGDTGRRTTGSGAQRLPLSPDGLAMSAARQRQHTGKNIAGEKDGETKIASTTIRSGKRRAGKEKDEAHERNNPFAYTVAEDEADSVFYRVYLAEQNWNNRPWVDRVKNGNTEKQVRRSFARVVLLKEYYPSRTFYVEDNSGQRILGWVRPPL